MEALNGLVASAAVLPAALLADSLALRVLAAGGGAIGQRDDFYRRLCRECRRPRAGSQCVAEMSRFALRGLEARCRFRHEESIDDVLQRAHVKPQHIHLEAEENAIVDLPFYFAIFVASEAELGRVFRGAGWRFWKGQEAVKGAAIRH